jgi:hypothetical protein
VPTATLIIGRDEVGEEFTILHYDSRGVSRVYRMMFDDGAWRMWRDAPGFWQRFSGRLSALYDGNPGEASGGNHGQAWSTRFMFRNDSKDEGCVYTPAGDGYGKDIGLGCGTSRPTATPTPSSSR